MAPLHPRGTRPAHILAAPPTRVSILHLYVATHEREPRSADQAVVRKSALRVLRGIALKHYLLPRTTRPSAGTRSILIAMPCRRASPCVCHRCLYHPEPSAHHGGDSRKEHAAVGHRVLRRGDDSNAVMVLTEFPDRAKAEAFVEDPSLRAAMGRAGIEGAPAITFWEDAEELAY